MRRRGELKLTEQALRGGWNITDVGRQDALALVQDVLNDDAATDRERLRACKVVVLMQEQNLLLDEHQNLLERVKLLGLLYSR